MLLSLLFMIMPGLGHGKCSSINTTFQQNHIILFNLLIKNTPLHDGFYTSSVGNDSNQVFGVAQCKANISSKACTDCLKFAIGSYDGCPDSREGETMSTDCTTEISKENVTGIWTNSSMATFGANDLDDALVFSKGFSMMQELATTVPYQPLMYQAAEIDVGAYGKRYGLGQCGRDLSKLVCQNCLQDRLKTYRSYVENRTGWEIVGPSCSMWYVNASDAYNKDVNAAGPTPLDNQFPPGTASVASGVGSMGIATFVMLFVATHVLHLS
ncbi:hypothetical protein QVD17_31355 [Tagetes erecta]|uniref:Gnk2-homologous domain-containing protein n=1 Tax=Tagetes erecta TaxID=13708 RepID=A0AAD8K7C8_TARER|nr:hypothetical protein QVD17_31355 [Tagetes erecta]